MIKKLVCFDDESLRDLSLLENLLKMNRSQVIRYLLREKVDGIARTQFNSTSKGINQNKEKDILIEGVDLCIK